MLTRSLGLDIPLRQPKQILKHFNNDKLNIKKLKHLGLRWFELFLCLMKKGFSHFPIFSHMYKYICMCSGFLTFPVELFVFVFVCVQVFLLSQLKCLYLYVLRSSYFPCWTVCICICICSGCLTFPVGVIVFVFVSAQVFLLFVFVCVQVFSVSQLKCRRKKKLVRLWHKPTPGEHAGSNKYKRKNQR